MRRATLVVLMVIAIEATVSYASLMMGYMNAMSTSSRASQRAESRKGWHNDWMKVKKVDHAHKGRITSRCSFARQRLFIPVFVRNLVFILKAFKQPSSTPHHDQAKSPIGRTE